jgi:transaldolase
MNPLLGLQKCGQAVWLDYLRRDMISNGELQRLIDEDGLSGMTSNPTIFEKALSGDSSDYDVQLQELLGRDPHATSQSLFEELAIQDIQTAADLLSPVYADRQMADGFVCFEVSPMIAYDTKATIMEARRLWEKVDRPNVMIKVPATKEGIPAIEQLISEAINVNITLMFSQAHYEAVAHAYINGLKRCSRPQSVSSVASFFVSRVDTVVDKALEKIDTPEALELRGQAAIANSKMIYRRFRQIFDEASFTVLNHMTGARLQRPLWASTSTKNPAYFDVMYVESLVGRDTVNTMTPETLKAFRDHGHIIKDVVQEGNPEEVLARLAGFDIDLNEIGEQLQQEGVRSFELSYEKMICAITERSMSMGAKR